MEVLICGERGIRTPGGLTLNGFQDRRNRPLCHLSGAKIVQKLYGNVDSLTDRKTFIQAAFLIIKVQLINVNNYQKMTNKKAVLLYILLNFTSTN